MRENKLVNASGGDISGSLASGRLLKVLAEELKNPLMQIARSAELARITEKPLYSADLEVTADAALRLLDGYVLSTQAMLGQQSLQLEPVSVQAALYDTAQYLQRFAKLYNCRLELSTKGRCGLAMANPRTLQAALTSLGYSFINALSTEGKPQKIRLIAKAGKKGISTGVLVDSTTLGGHMLRQAKALYGQARQPLAEFTHSSGAGIFVADSLFDSMATRLQIIHGAKTSGLAATLLPSRQLSLL